jgi:hypothetical protein
VVLRAEALAPAEVGRPVGLVQPADQFQAAPLEHHQVRPIGHQGVGQEDIPGAEGAPQPAEQADLALPLAGVPADPEVRDGPASQGDEGPRARDREARARPLVVDLRVGLLVLRGVRHADRRAVEQVDVPAFPQPAGVHGGLQGTPSLARHVGEEGFGQALAGLAVGAGLCRARALPPRQAVGDQAGDGAAAGLVGAEDLSQEDPQRDQGGEDQGNRISRS